MGYHFLLMKIRSSKEPLVAREIVGQTKNFFILGLLEKHSSLV